MFNAAGRWLRMLVDSLTDVRNDRDVVEDADVCSISSRMFRSSFAMQSEMTSILESIPIAFVLCLFCSVAFTVVS